MRRIQLLAYIIFSLLLISCSSTKPELSLSSDNLPGTYILFGFRMVNEGSMDKVPSSCKLELVELETQRRIRVQLWKDQSTVLAPVESEHYKIHELHCGSGFRYRIGNIFGTSDGKLQAHPGKINFLGYSQFIFSKNAELSFQWKSKSSSDFLKRIYSKTSSTARDKLVNAFTGKPISHKTLEATVDKRNFGVTYAKSSTVSSALVEQVMTDFKKNLQRCIDEEERTNPLRIGKIFYKVRYDEMRMKNLDLVTDLSTYSERYHSCLETSFKAFVPAFQDEIEFSVEL
jgi:hypothetical protein